MTEQAFCPHGLPDDGDCELCRDEQERADDQVTDGDATDFDGWALAAALAGPKHEWLDRYHAALDEGFSMSAAIHKANEGESDGD